MKNRFAALLLVFPLASHAICSIYNPPQLIPINTSHAFSPSIYSAMLVDYAIYSAIEDAANSWNGTDANGRLIGWRGVVTTSNCPPSQPFQVTAYPFATPTCSPAIEYNLHEVTNPNYVVRAFVDADPSICAGCGTKSISINTSLAWSVDGTPAPGEYDLHAVLSHEFGHVLTFGHMDLGVCTGFSISPTCSADPSRETMGNYVYSGTDGICTRTPAANDVTNANSIY